MKNKKIFFLVDTKANLKEADELISFTTELFETKLATLEELCNLSSLADEKKMIETQAYQLYDAYKKSLKEIEIHAQSLLMKPDTYEQTRTT